MTDNQDDFSIIRTKLHRPRVPNNHVYREMLVERLQSYRRRPAILVSAAAGYGKSTLVSSWLEMCGRPSAWLSLDENDNESAHVSGLFDSRRSKPVSRFAHK